MPPPPVNSFRYPYLNAPITIIIEGSYCVFQCHGSKMQKLCLLFILDKEAGYFQCSPPLGGYDAFLSWAVIANCYVTGVTDVSRDNWKPLKGRISFHSFDSFMSHLHLHLCLINNAVLLKAIHPLSLLICQKGMCSKTTERSALCGACMLKA